MRRQVVPDHDGRRATEEAAQLLEDTDQGVVVVAARLDMETQPGPRSVRPEQQIPAIEARFQ